MKVDSALLVYDLYTQFIETCILQGNSLLTDDKEILQVLMKKKQDILREQNAVGILNK